MHKWRIGLTFWKNGRQFKFFSGNEESEWLTNIDPSLLDKSNEERSRKAVRQQISHSNSIPLRILLSHIPHKKNIHEICLHIHVHDNLACWIVNILLDILLCNITENFNSLFVFWLPPQARKNTQWYYTTKCLIRHTYYTYYSGGPVVSWLVHLSPFRAKPLKLFYSQLKVCTFGRGRVYTSVIEVEV